MSEAINTLPVAFMCCDENGVNLGCLRQIDVASLLDMEAISLQRPPRISFVSFGPLVRLVRISGRYFPVKARAHSGNPTVEAFWMEAAVVAELLNFLKGRRTFDSTGGDIEIGDIWDSEHREFTWEALCRRESAVAPVTPRDLFRNDLERPNGFRKAVVRG